MTYVIQGIASVFGKIFSHDGKFLRIASGSFDKSLQEGHATELLINHNKQQSFGSKEDRLELHANSDYLAFRFHIPDSCSKAFEEAADDFESYVGVSIGLLPIQTEVIDIGSQSVTTVNEAKLTEISLLDGTPAMDSTFGRLVSYDYCETLEEDCLSGKMLLHSRFISLHRKFRASESGEAIEFKHVSTNYDKAANRFVRTLLSL